MTGPGDKGNAARKNSHHDLPVVWLSEGPGWPGPGLAKNSVRGSRGDEDVLELEELINSSVSSLPSETALLDSTERARR